MARSPGQVAGDISPNYALLPSFAIEHIRKLKPDIKLVMLIREPSARAWSHLRHCLRHGEANFRDGTTNASLSAEDCVRNLVHDYTLSSGDYVSTLRRWLACFPRHQFHIDFFELATREPERYLNDLFRFLGVRTIGNFADYPIADKINASDDTLSQRMPEAVGIWSNLIFGRRREQTKNFVASEFDLHAPWGVGPVTTKNVRILPSIPDLPGWSIEVSEGLFRTRCSPGSKLVRTAAYLYDLSCDLEPLRQSYKAVLGRPNSSVEDCRLTRELNKLAETLLKQGITPCPITGLNRTGKLGPLM